MRKVLMILTSHRLDCLKVNLELLAAHGDLQKFDKVVLLLSGVTGAHRQYVDQFVGEHAEVEWDIIEGPRGKKKIVADLQNECIRRNPEALYFKIDEDVFTSKGWVDKLENAYLAQQGDPSLALLTPVVPNNGIGCYFLLTKLADFRERYDEQFSYPVKPDYEAPVWLRPSLGQFMTRLCMDMAQINQRLESMHGAEFQREHALYFDHRFTINCICYDYRHVTEMGGIPDEEEPAWTHWATTHGKQHVLVPNVLVHHYSFFVQQDWMDRSHILEEFRRVNLPGTMGGPGSLSYELPRLQRVIKQAPRALVRKAKHLAKR
jgi:hypothetical protein